MRIKENKRNGFTMGTWRAQKKLKKIKNKKVEGGGGEGESWDLNLLALGS